MPVRYRARTRFPALMLAFSHPPNVTRVPVYLRPSTRYSYRTVGMTYDDLGIRNPPAVRLGVQNPPRRRGPVCAATREPDLPDEVPGRHSEGEEPDKRRNDPFDERHDLGSLRRLVLLRSPGWFGSHIYGAFLRTSSNAHHPVTFRAPLAGTHSVYAELADDPRCTGNVSTE